MYCVFLGCYFIDGVHSLILTYICTLSRLLIWSLIPRVGRSGSGLGLARPSEDSWSWTSRLLVLKVGNVEAVDFFSVFSRSERRIDVILSFFYGNVRWIRLAEAGSLQVSYILKIKIIKNIRENEKKKINKWVLLCFP